MLGALLVARSPGARWQEMLVVGENAAAWGAIIVAILTAVITPVVSLKVAWVGVAGVLGAAERTAQAQREAAGVAAEAQRLAAATAAQAQLEIAATMAQAQVDAARRAAEAQQRAADTTARSVLEFDRQRARRERHMERPRPFLEDADRKYYQHAALVVAAYEGSTEAIQAAIEAVAQHGQFERSPVSVMARRPNELGSALARLQKAELERHAAPVSLMDRLVVTEEAITADRDSAELLATANVEVGEAIAHLYDVLDSYLDGGPAPA
jgi:hypothetical protein